MTARVCYLFGPFRLSADGTMLLRDGAAVPLAPKALRTLLTLVEHAGEVVTKQHLLETVWPDSFVEDTGLTRNISVIRQALGEEGERFIVTVARLGYRFTAQVERIEKDMTPRASRIAALARGDRSAPMVGRADELETLRSAFENVVGAPGRMIAVTGEPGIGKTTAVDSFLLQIEGRCRIGRGRCSERLAGAEPHLPILEALEELIADDPHMVEILGRRAPTWLRHIAPRPSPVRPHGSDSVEQDAARTSERLMRELTTFLEESSAEKPLVLVVEDLHWTDLSTVDVLVHLAARLSRLRLLIIITYRHHELALRDHPFMRARSELMARGQLEELAVSLLTPEEVRELRPVGIRRRGDPAGPARPGIPEDRRQPVVHGGPRPVPAKARCRRRGRAHGARRARLIARVDRSNPWRPSAGGTADRLHCGRARTRIRFGNARPRVRVAAGRG
jgi:DNA-binding winged helix-turn-helix (wHTH) protein